MNAEDIDSEYQGSLLQAVTAVMDFGRALWELAYPPAGTTVRDVRHTPGCTVLTETQLLDLLAAPQHSHAASILEELRQRDVYRPVEPGIVEFHGDVFQPVELVRMLLGGIRSAHDLRYFVMQNIRSHYGLVLSHEMPQLFYMLATTINDRSVAPGSLKQRTHWEYAHDFRMPLVAALQARSSSVEQAQRTASMFIECCRAVSYVKASYKPNSILCRATIDAEYLLAKLFGLPTNMRGFDDLFGGGLMLTESIPGDMSASRLGGRTVLIKGRSGTGKTLLALKLAVEVASKGGLAWVMPLEQSHEECLYALASIGALPDTQVVEVATDPFAAAALLQERPGERGALIILKTIKDSYESFLSAFAENAKRMLKYPLRLIIADPVNSIARGDRGERSEPPDVAALRARTMDRIEVVNKAGTNVLLVAEEGNDPVDELLFEQNIADTVIRLGVDDRSGYDQRTFEIMKSRFQREQRGEHPFAIKPGQGISIFPSSPAVMSRIRSRSLLPPDAPIHFGHTGLDMILGEKSLRAGDVIVMQGPEGSYKTPLGLLFLLGTDQPENRKRVSLLVAVRDDESKIREMLKQGFIQRSSDTRKQQKEIRVCSLPRGYVEPGFIMQQIEDEFEAALRDGNRIDRVMIDDIAHWELSCPLVRAEETFGDTLVEFLRRKNVTSLYVCGEVEPETAFVLQRSIANNADCGIEFNRFEYGGIQRVTLRVLRSHGMAHRRESFEVTFDTQRLEIKPISSLLRVGPNGEIKPINVRLFLHSETYMQDKYNRMLVQAVKAMLSRETEVESEDPVGMSRAMRLGSSSALNELQIVQWDEYQFSTSDHDPSQRLMFHTFPNKHWDDSEWGEVGADASGHVRWGHFVPRLIRRNGDTVNTFFVLPFYANIGLLAYRRDEQLDAVVTSWERLADACDAWTQRQAEAARQSVEGSDQPPHKPFFDFPKGTSENYNCLFLEILLSLEKPEPKAVPSLLKQLQGPVSIHASKIFRQLCRQSYLAGGGNDLVRPTTRAADATPNVNVAVTSDAMVWRHWYTTLNQMLSGMELKDQQQIKVVPLPEQIAIAGDWYIGIPAYSAAPDVGLEVIKFLTSRDAETERLRKGVGLPTRQPFYADGSDGHSIDTAISPYFSMSVDTVRTLVSEAYQRSDIRSYARLSSTLARCLQRIIEIPDDQSAYLDQRIKDIFRDLRI
ncbi:MAG TPA: ATPase domain-containing protein [Herpetosiphonaceae bacterium]